MITYHLKLSGQDPRVLYSDMEFVAGDVGAYRLVFSFFDEDAPLSLSGKILAVKIKRADGVVLSDSGEITNDTAVYIPKNDCFCVPGSVTFEIALMDSAKNYITTKIIHARVLESVGEPSDTAGDSSSAYVTLLTQTKAQLDAANQACDTAKALLSETENSLTEKADKATSLSGYGITDAYTKTEVDDTIASIKTAKADKATTLSGYGIADAYTKKEANDLYANALKATAIGSVVSLDDVSPLAHTLKVWAHSKNLFRFTADYTGEKNGVAMSVEKGKSTISVNGTATVAASVDNCCRITLPAGKYTVSITNAYGVDYLYVRNITEDKYYNNVVSTRPLTFEVTEETELDMGFVIRQGSSYDHATIFIQLEEGTAKTEFEPYVDEIGNHILVNGEEYPVNADGTVDGVQSIAPNMTMRTDTQGVALNVKYNQDTNKVIERLIQAIISLGGNV